MIYIDNIIICYKRGSSHCQCKSNLKASTNYKNLIIRNLLSRIKCLLIYFHLKIIRAVIFLMNYEKN